jgi:hypothetical protein
MSNFLKEHDIMNYLNNLPLWSLQDGVQQTGK